MARYSKENVSRVARVKEIKDGNGRTWQLALTVSAILRVRDLVKVSQVDEDGETHLVPLDLANIQQIDSVLSALRLNYTSLGEVLYAAMMPQVESRKLTREEFLDSLSGDCLDSASDAVIDELICFFPNRHRRVVRMMVDKYDEMTAAAVATAEKQVEASGLPSGNVPESSESTQAIGHTGSSKPRRTPRSKTTGGTPQTSSA